MLADIHRIRSDDQRQALTRNIKQRDFFTIAFAVAIPRKSYILVQFSLASSSLSRSSKTLATLIPVLALFLYRLPSSSTSSFLYYSVILLFS